MMAGWGTKLVAVGTAVTAPLAALLKITGSMGNNFVAMSDRTGIGIEALTAMDYVASQTGTTLDEFENGVKNMQKSLVGAADGAAENVGVFEKLGLTLADLRGMNPEAQFFKIADAMAKITDPSTRAALAMKIFGKSGTALLPMLKEGQGGLRAMIQRATDLGVVLSEKDVRACGAFNDKLSELWYVGRSAAVSIAVSLIPMLTDAANKIEVWSAETVKWLKANKELIVWTALIGVTVLAAGAALFVLGKALAWSMSLALGMSSALTAVWGIITAIGGAIATVFTSPILATIAVIVALGAVLLWVSGVGGKVIDWLGSRFAELRAFATASFRGIADALLAGDIQLAAEILWKTLEVAFLTGKNAVLGVWYGMVSSIESVWFAMGDTIKDAWDAIVTWVVNKILDVAKHINHILNVYSKLRTELAGSSFTIGGVKISGSAFANLPKLPMSVDDATFNAEMEKRKSQNNGDLDMHRQERQDELQKKINDLQSDPTVGGRLQLNRLNEELGYLLKQAAKERGMADGAMGAIPSPPALIDGINQLKAAHFGTFSAQGAAAAGGVAGSSALIIAAQKTATNTDNTAKGVAKLVDQGGPTFT